MKGMVRIARMLVVVWVAGIGVARAHPGVRERVASVDHHIAHHPRDARAYLRRGELSVEAGRYEPAMADFRRARELAPHLPEIHFFQGLLWLEAGDPARADEALSSFLTTRPGHAKARLLRARARAALMRPREAVDDISVALALLDRPTPEPYFLRARLLAAMTPAAVPEAVHGLDEGIARLDAPVALVELAIDLQIRRGELTDALARMQQLPARSRDTPHWHKQRGDLLRRLGRDAEAAWAYLTALGRCNVLSAHRRSVPAMARLKVELRRGLVDIVHEALA